jgi:clan AA aspartic protease (TIGR02281 family)
MRIGFVIGLVLACASLANAESIALKQEGGTFVVPVLINDKITLNFTIDSGAADVSIPADVFSTLVRAGTITTADLRDKGLYKLADGSQRTSQRFRIRSLQVGNLTLRDVLASVAPPSGSLLLGQSFLARLESWSINNQRQVLEINQLSPAQAPASATLPSYVPPAAAKIYTYLDADGNRHYTDVPDSRYRLLLISPQDPTDSGQHYDPALLARATLYDAIIEHAAVSSAVEPNLLRAIIVVGSGFDSRAVSKHGAVGLMQLMPATATRFGVSNPYDPKQNVHAGARYLKFLIDRFGQDIRLALAAYNAGEEAVDRNGGQIPPFTETMAYVPRVLRIYRMLTEQPRTT